MENYYRKNLEVTELDLLFFLRKGRAKMFNQKFTPLEKQGHIYKMNSVLTNKGDQQVTSFIYEFCDSHPFINGIYQHLPSQIESLMT